LNRTLSSRFGIYLLNC